MNPIAKGIIIHDYDAAEYDELSVKKRDKFDLLQEFEDGWWHVQVKGQQGMIPGNYAKIIERIRPLTNPPSVSGPPLTDDQENPPFSPMSFITPRPSSSDPDLESHSMNHTPSTTRNNEIDRFQALRQETSNKIDELK